MTRIISSATLFIVATAMFILFSPAFARTFQTADNRFVAYTDIGQIV